MDDDGMPIVQDAVASIRCIHDGLMPYGTHAIIVGRVTDVRAGVDGAALEYCRGEYRVPAQAS